MYITIRTRKGRRAKETRVAACQGASYNNMYVLRRKEKGEVNGGKRENEAAVTMGVSVAHTKETFKLIACIKFDHCN